MPPPVHCAPPTSGPALTQCLSVLTHLGTCYQSLDFHGEPSVLLKFIEIFCLYKTCTELLAPVMARHCPSELKATLILNL